MTEKNTQIHFEHIKNNAPILYFKINKNGVIKDTNQYTKDVVGKTGSDIKFQELVVDFESKIDFDEIFTSSDEHLFSINTKSGNPESFIFKFYGSKDTILIFAHHDIVESRKINKEMILLNQELSNVNRELHKKKAQLQHALDHIKKLKGFIPICSHCHKIRNDKQIWNKLEKYIAENTDAVLSHGICPNCMEEHYQDFAD